MKKLPLLLLVLFAACTETDNNDLLKNGMQNNISLSIENTILNDSEIAIVDVDNYTLSEETYNGMLGDNVITLAKVNDSTLTFIVPSGISSGQYPLSMDISDETLLIEVVKTDDIADATTYVTDFIADYETEINNILSSPYNTISETELLEIKNQFAKAISDFNNLSDEDKQVAAKFIRNNSEELNNLENAIADYQANVGSGINKKTLANTAACDFSCILFNGAKVLGAAALVKVSATAGLIAGLAIGIEVGLSVITNKNSILMSGVIAVIKEAFSLAYFAQNYLANLTYDFIDKKFTSEFNKSASTRYEFESGSAITFRIKPIYRTLNEEDKNSSDNIVSSFVNSYLKFKTYWNKNYASKLGALPDFNNYTEQRTADNLSDYSIDITNNSANVSASAISGTTYEFEVTFTTTETTNQDFTFDIVFNDGKTTAKNTVNATLIPSDPPLKSGYYELRYSWEEKVVLFHVARNSTQYSRGDIYYWDSSDSFWFDPSFSATFSAYKYQDDNGGDIVSVSVNTGGCLSEGFKLENFNPDATTHSGTYTSARCYHSENIGSSVNLKYVGELVANVKY